MSAQRSRLILAVMLIAGIALAGCASSPYGNRRDVNSGYGYQGQPQGGYGGRSDRGRCQNCGVVKEVQQVYVQGGGNGGTIGAIIGAVAGGVLGNTVGKGDGRKAATVAGAVAGGVVGNQVGKRNDGSTTAWRIVVRMDNGQYVTVTQRDNPGFRNGDYVILRGDKVYAR
ncbi:MAG: glycine zipper 2TM domain-containing protein [Rhodanobacter sp.]|nr:MAG: glycine zipper 2TM domain-containing protein [Rhodanobacter sp.]